MTLEFVKCAKKFTCRQRDQEEVYGLPHRHNLHIVGHLSMTTCPSILGTLSRSRPVFAFPKAQIQHHRYPRPRRAICLRNKEFCMVVQSLCCNLFSCAHSSCVEDIPQAKCFCHDIYSYSALSSYIFYKLWRLLCDILQATVG